MKTLKVPEHLWIQIYAIYDSEHPIWKFVATPCSLYLDDLWYIWYVNPTVINALYLLIHIPYIRIQVIHPDLLIFHQLLQFFHFDLPPQILSRSPPPLNNLCSLQSFFHFGFVIPIQNLSIFIHLFDFQLLLLDL